VKPKPKIRSLGSPSQKNGDQSQAGRWNGTSTGTLQAGTAADSQVLRNVGTLISSGTSLYVTLVILIPRFYNPETDGIRRAVEADKIMQTVREIRRQFSGYSRFAIHGWYRDDDDEEFSDRLVRFEIDFLPDRRRLESLKAWKKTLERRFRQRAIYFRFTPAVCW